MAKMLVSSYSNGQFYWNWPSTGTMSGRRSALCPITVTTRHDGRGAGIQTLTIKNTAGNHGHVPTLLVPRFGATGNGHFAHSGSQTAVWQ